MMPFGGISCDSLAISGSDGAANGLFLSVIYNMAPGPAPASAYSDLAQLDPEDWQGLRSAVRLRLACCTIYNPFLIKDMLLGV